MQSQELITSKEAIQFKQYLLQNTSEEKNDRLMASFNKTRSLFSLRSVMRGYLGMPRLRRSDSLTKSSKRTLSPIKTDAHGAHFKGIQSIIDSP